VWTWSATRGLARDGRDRQPNTGSATTAIAFCASIRLPGVFVFHDVAAALADPVTVRAVKERALEAPDGQTFVLTGPSIQVPDELRGLALLWRLEPPSSEEIERLVRETLDELRTRHLAGVSLTPERTRELEKSLRGLTIAEAQRLILQAGLDDGRLDEDDLPQVRQAKAELLAEDGVLTIVPTEEGGLDRVGGLDRLKAWLATRGRGFGPAAEAYGLDAPRGVLLIGVPGCGKSLVAKSLARSWGMPLVHFDPGAIYQAFVGES
jgi:hypothetical protein